MIAAVLNKQRLVKRNAGSILTLNEAFGNANSDAFWGFYQFPSFNQVSLQTTGLSSWVSRLLAKERKDDRDLKRASRDLLKGILEEASKNRFNKI